MDCPGANQDFRDEELLTKRLDYGTTQDMLSLFFIFFNDAFSATETI
jgi:hypothetical protein